MDTFLCKNCDHRYTVDSFGPIPGTCVFCYLRLQRGDLRYFHEYNREVRRTCNPNVAVPCALGLCGEAGEVADLLKKHWFHGHDLDKDALTKELGDVLWYLTALADEFDISLEDIVKTNVAKLRQRYPNGWDQERSINREDKGGQ